MDVERSVLTLKNRLDFFFLFLQLELIFAMENLDEIKTRFLTSAEQIAQTSPFNLEWLKKNKSSV